MRKAKKEGQGRGKDKKEKEKVVKETAVQIYRGEGRRGENDKIIWKGKR